MSQSDREIPRLTVLKISSAVLAGLGALCSWGSLPSASADDGVEIAISIKDHKFEPSEIKVPAGKALKITVTNNDATAEEFESHKLKIEKVIAGNATATVRVKPLEKGSYTFVGEYHEDTAKGVVTAE